MASYVTYIGDRQVLIEAPVAGAFAKSDSEIQPEPKKAIINMMETIKAIADYAGRELGPTLRKTGAAFEINFAVRADSQGLTMISEHANVGQFQVSVKWPPARPPAPPAGAPGGPPPPRALPQNDSE